MGGACSTDVEMGNAYEIIFEKSEGKSPPERPRYRWKDNINMDLKEIGYEVMDLDISGSG